MKHSWLALLASTAASVQAQQQTPLVLDSHDDVRLHQFEPSVKRVAVIGAGKSHCVCQHTMLINTRAGISGLQIAAQLIDRNFTVRLFDRAPGPGGNWFYSEETQVRESYPYVVVA